MFAGFAAALRIANIIATAIPVLHALVLLAENTVPGAKQGASKLDQVLTMAAPVLSVLGATPQDSATLSPIVRSIIAGIVAASNASGTFTSSSSSSAPSTP